MCDCDYDTDDSVNYPFSLHNDDNGALYRINESTGTTWMRRAQWRKDAVGASKEYVYWQEIHEIPPSEPKQEESKKEEPKKEDPTLGYDFSWYWWWQTNGKPEVVKVTNTNTTTTAAKRA